MATPGFGIAYSAFHTSSALGLNGLAVGRRPSPGGIIRGICSGAGKESRHDGSNKRMTPMTPFRSRMIEDMTPAGLLLAGTNQTCIDYCDAKSVLLKWLKKSLPPCRGCGRSTQKADSPTDGQRGRSGPTRDMQKDTMNPPDLLLLNALSHTIYAVLVKYQVSRTDLIFRIEC
jgi:hypothetical protein